MTYLSGLYICEGTSDLPLVDVIQNLLSDRGLSVNLTAPDYQLLKDRVASDVASKLRADIELKQAVPDLVVIHPDQDNSRLGARRAEISNATQELCYQAQVIPVIPVRMTEAWLLLDEASIRRVAGNPSGKATLTLPPRSGIERVADPKAILQRAILEASEATGKRRALLAQRFPQNRRRLLELLDPDGPVSSLPSWQALLADIESVTKHFGACPHSDR